MIVANLTPVEMHAERAFSKKLLQVVNFPFYGGEKGAVRLFFALFITSSSQPIRESHASCAKNLRVCVERFFVFARFISKDKTAREKAWKTRGKKCRFLKAKEGLEKLGKTVEKGLFLMLLFSIEKCRK